MDARLIFFSMAAIMLLLALLVPFFRKYEVRKTKLEVAYFEALKKFYDNQKDTSAKEKAIAAGQLHFFNLGINERESSLLIQKDLLLELKS